MKLTCGLCGTTDSNAIHGPWAYCASCAPLAAWEPRLADILSRLTPDQKRALAVAMTLLGHRMVNQAGTEDYYDAALQVYAVAEGWARENAA